MSAQSTRVTLPEKIVISTLPPLKESLAGALDTSKQITVAAEAVTRIDAAGLQLLFAFIREARESDVTLEWEAPSSALSDAATLLGLGAELGLSA